MAGGVRPAETEETERTLEATLSSPTSCHRGGRLREEQRLTGRRTGSGSSPESRTRVWLFQAVKIPPAALRKGRGLARLEKGWEGETKQPLPAYDKTDKGNRGSGHGAPL